MDVSTMVHSLLTGLRYNKVYIGNNTQFQKSNITAHLNGYACCLGTTFTFAVLEPSGSIYLSLWPQ